MAGRRLLQIQSWPMSGQGQKRSLVGQTDRNKEKGATRPPFSLLDLPGCLRQLLSNDGQHCFKFMNCQRGDQPCITPVQSLSLIHI